MNNRDGSVPSSEQAVEQKIQDLGLTAPRITPAHIDSVIVSEHYFTASDGVLAAASATDAVDTDPVAFMNSIPAPLGLLTFCVLVLKNGFTVTGESACASPENFNAELGRTIAKRNARDKIWSLEGYQLRTQIANSPVVRP